MKYLGIILIHFLFENSSLSQTDSILFHSYVVKVQENIFRVENSAGETKFEKLFSNPFAYTADVDSDSLDELIVVDSINYESGVRFNIYFFSGENQFMLIDSIYSGTYFPFLTFSEELEAIIIETGNPDFEIFNESSEFTYLPLNVWQLIDDKLFLINDELYEPFIFENGNLIQLLEFYTKTEIDCAASKKIKNLIASAYTNYINAGEISLASQLLKKYYVCEDLAIFKQQILDLIYPKASQ